MSSICRRLHEILCHPVNSRAQIMTCDDRKLQVLVNNFKKSSESAEFRARFNPYSLVIRRLAAANKYSLVDDIHEHRMKFDDISDGVFVSRTIALYGKVGMLDRAHKLFDEMDEMNCKRTVRSFNSLLTGYLRGGNADKIHAIWKELAHKHEIKPDVVSFNIVMKAFCMKGNIDSGRSLIDEMEEKGVEPDVVSYNTLLNAFYMGGRFDDGEKIWSLMEEKNVLRNTESYNSRIRGLVSERRTTDAISLLGEMERNDIDPNVISFNGLIAGFCNDDNLEEVKNWLGKLRENNLMPDRVTYITVIPFLCAKNDLSMALDLCKEIMNRGLFFRGAIVHGVINALAKEQRTEEAMQLIELAKSRKFHYQFALPSEKV